MTIRAARVEKAWNLPGDHYLSRIDFRATFGITVEAPRMAIWPWLVQMGCGRAGWYSYDWLDNGGRPSARRLLPEWQELAIGDHLPGSLSDPPGEGFEVIDLEPEHYLLLSTYNHLPNFEPVGDGERPEQFWRTTWCFYLQPLSGQRTRLIVRSNLQFRPRWLVYLPAQLVARPVHYLMQRKQLLGIKERVETSVAQVHTGEREYEAAC